MDEVLHGTNSHDRRMGAEAIVRSLVNRGAIGLLTSPDLALAHIAEMPRPRSAKVHFALPSVGAWFSEVLLYRKGSNRGTHSILASGYRCPEMAR
jgi:hypothetical protein